MIKSKNLFFFISLVIFIQCSKTEDFENVNTGIYDGTDFNYEGEVITKLFTFSGNKLEINYSTSVVGAIKFEIQDQDGNPIPGYTMEDCQPVTGDEISGIVTWTQGNDLKNLNSKTVRLRILMKDADLYSIKFTNIQ